jgi:hypothetical protein
MDRSIITPSRSGTYVVATLRQLLDGDVARIPSGLEITLSDQDCRNWIKIKGENSQTAERAAEAVLRALNVTPDLMPDVKPDRSIDEERIPAKERSNERPSHGFD